MKTGRRVPVGHLRDRIAGRDGDTLEADRQEKPVTLPVDPNLRLAAERTLLAWIRTGLALMGFGFVVARFGLFLREMAAIGHVANPPGWSHWVGMILVLIGVLVHLLAAAEYSQLLRRLGQGVANPFPRRSLGVAVSIVLAMIGAAMVGYMLAT